MSNFNFKNFIYNCLKYLTVIKIVILFKIVNFFVLKVTKVLKKFTKYFENNNIKIVKN